MTLRAHSPYCKQQRPVCSADCITTPLTSRATGLRALMQLCNTNPCADSEKNGLDVTIGVAVILHVCIERAIRSLVMSYEKGTQAYKVIEEELRC